MSEGVLPLNTPSIYILALGGVDDIEIFIRSFVMSDYIVPPGQV